MVAKGNEKPAMSRTVSTKAMSTSESVVRARQLATRVAEIDSLKQLPAYVLRGKEDKKAKTVSGSSQVAAFESEKKYKKNLEMLKSEIEERNRRIEAQASEILEANKKI